MKNLFALAIIPILIIGCTKEKNETPNESKKPFVLAAGEIDADSTVYYDFVPDKELFFESDIMDTIDHFDTLGIDSDLDSLNNFYIVIEHKNIDLIMYVSGYLINNNDMSFANYHYAHGLKKGDLINDSLTWDSSDNLTLFYWSSGSNPTWTSSYFIAFKFTEDNKVKFGWLSTVWEAYVDDYASYISSFRYSVIDLAFEK
jgi:hypothetical protein